MSKPPFSLGVMSTTSIFQPFFSAHFWYMRNRSDANSAASSPPSAPWISTTTSLSSLGSFGSSMISGSPRAPRPARLHGAPRSAEIPASPRPSHGAACRAPIPSRAAPAGSARTWSRPLAARPARAPAWSASRDRWPPRGAPSPPRSRGTAARSLRAGRSPRRARKARDMCKTRGILPAQRRDMRKKGGMAYQAAASCSSPSRALLKAAIATSSMSSEGSRVVNFCVPSTGSSSTRMIGFVRWRAM